MNARLLWTTLRAESRGARGRLVFVGACLAVGVAAVTGVSALTGSIADGIAARSRVLLGADLALESRRPLPEDLDATLSELWQEMRPGAAPIERVDTLEMATLAGAAGDEDVAPSRLSELKVVGEAWPLYGELKADPPLAVAALGPERCAIAPDLAAGLGLRVGDALRLGGVEFEVAALVLEEPDELQFGFSAGPRVLITHAGLSRTQLVGFGSRVEHKALLRLPGELDNRELHRLEDELEFRLGDAGGLRVRTHDRAQPALRRGLDRIERYLGLVALLSLLLGAAGVAQVVRAWIAQRTTSIAVLRALGWRPREVLGLFVLHVAALAALASAAGATLGALAPLALTTFAGDLFPEGMVHVWQPLAWARGVALGSGVALFFALVPLLGVGRVPPVHVLRAEAAPLALPRPLLWGAQVLALLAIFGAAWTQGGELDEAAAFTAGLAVLAGLLWLASRALAWVARHVPRERFPPALTHGVAALGRPSSGTTAAIVALGVGVLVVVAMQLVQERLRREFATAIPADAPTVFLVDVQPPQAAGVRALLEESRAARIDEVPVVTARLSAIDGVGIDALGDAPDGRRRSRWSLSREQRLTWMPALPADNVLIEGSLWSDPAAFEVSLEQDYAENLAVGLGSRLTFDVQGVPVELLVTSLRTVEWRSMGINFFLVAEPGALDEAPHMCLMAARLAPEVEDRFQSRSLSRFPNVTVLRVRGLIERVTDVFERLALAVRALGLLTVVAGLAILAGVAASSAAHRSQEVALLKTLGVTRRGVAVLFATEYALCGLVAGALGTLGALALAYEFLERVLELTPELPLAALPLAAAAMSALAACAGLAASARALAVRPLASLRG
jgi:putative ABC transport system permease protein